MRSVRIRSSGCNFSFFQSNINIPFLQIKMYGVIENKYPRQEERKSDDQNKEHLIKMEQGNRNILPLFLSNS